MTVQTIAGNTIVAVKFPAQLFTGDTFQDGAVCQSVVITAEAES